MTEVVTLTKCEYLVGELNEDLQPLVDMVMRNYNQGRNMSQEAEDIREEDIRIEFTPEIERITKTLCDEWKTAFDHEIELCWQNRPGEDPNESFWAVVHDHNESTNLHSHESAHDYEHGAHISAAFWIQVPQDSGDFVFQYQRNPYLREQKIIKAQAGKFLMFDSTLPHHVTKNRSNGLRIVISMNFRFKEEEENVSS
jgi:hypothetical protein